MQWRTSASTGETIVPIDRYSRPPNAVKVMFFFVFYFRGGKRENLSKQHTLTIGELRECWAQCAKTLASPAKHVLEASQKRWLIKMQRPYLLRAHADTE